MLKYPLASSAGMESTTQSDHVSIKISKELYEKVQNRVKMSNDEFKSVEDYITFLLTEVVNEAEPQGEANAYTKEEEEEIKGRLKNLGYI